ncbi:MAG TPA: hypothetical protein VHM31_22880 [Polyangia bacterium]|nr:hypothetical protein [Polyangia bacterium]
MGALLAALVLAMEIHASGDCPAAADVERQLAPLLGEATGTGTSDVATIKRRPDGSVAVSLADPEGRSVGDRQLPRARSCSDQAETVAVTLAIWEAQLHPEIALRLDRLTSAAAPPPPPPPPTVPEVALTRPAPPVQPAPGTTIALGVAAAGVGHAGGWSPGARIELGVGRPGARWHLRVSAVGVGRDTLDVPPGQASWWRAFVVVGPELEIGRGRRWVVVAGAGAAGGVASISGSGFSVNRSTFSLDVGGEARLRVEWRPGRLRPWLGASVVAWARRQAVDVQGVSTGSALPRVEPMAALGADFVW